ncbi:hypothetical protein [Amycolatopsis arida]|uniref:hypothetical protein n=1 Tax=Amycolatopsis arida TaxID=587909 RepID=UPI0010665C92|nr:hypothetical protein [Amycolatopsis arida]
MAELREPRGAEAARLLYADAARRLSDFARNLVRTSRDHGPGDYLHEALLATREAERLLALAVVVERANGTTWETIGDTEGITKQSAQKKWADAAATVAALADGLDRDLLRNLHTSSAGQLAEDLDTWYVRHLQPGDTADDVERPVSGYLLDPGPAPDLSTYDTLPDDAYEWLLSDHPWARAERIRRADSGWDAELRNASDVRDWTDRIQGTDLHERYPHNPEIAENLRELAELMRPIADKQQLHAHLESAVPDDVRVHRLREKWVTHKHARGEDDYRYPARLLGPSAAAYPPPASGFRTDTSDKGDR